METFIDSSLSAYFPGLVDICINDDGQLAYAILQNGELVFTQEYITERESFSIPETKHFQFTLPRASEVLRHFEDDDKSLYNDIMFYLKSFSALDDEQWAIVAHYVFLTYLHDHPSIDYCPYLLFNAVPERGKSRTGKSITYIAFRAVHLNELREANIFRFSQNLHGTLFFDLMDISKKAERNNCEDILLLRFEKGSRCARVLYPDQGAFNDTVYFEIYGPTIIASNKQLNDIMETRCLPITMPNRPGNYENPRPEFGLELKERLTAWRAKYLEVKFADIRPFEGISGRLWDITKSLFMINSLLPVDMQTLKKAILAIAGEKDESRKGTVEGRLIAIIKEITDEGGLDRYLEWSIKIKEIRDKYNGNKPENKKASFQWIGKRLKSMSFRNRHIHGYSEIIITIDEYKTLLRQYGYSTGELSKNSNSLPETLLEKDEQNLDDLREVDSCRVYVETERPFFNSSGDREYYEETQHTLRQGADKVNADVEHLNNKIVDQGSNDEIPF